MMIADYLNPSSYTFNLFMFLFVLFFAFFYASITFNAKDIAENLKNKVDLFHKTRARYS